MLTINYTTKSLEEWDRELDNILEPSWFDTVVAQIEKSGGVAQNVLERRKACYIRLIQRPSAGVPGLWRRWYEEKFGEKCPV